MSVTESDLLQGLAQEEIAEITTMGSSRVLPKGSILFSLGEEAQDLFVVTRGRVNLTLPMRLGPENGDILVEERLPGQLLGWSGLVPPHRYTLQAVCREESELVALPRADLLKLFSLRPELGYRVLSNVARIIGERLQLFQTMWVREMQRSMEKRSA